MNTEKRHNNTSTQHFTLNEDYINTSLICR